MQRVFILVNAEPGKLWNIEDKAAKAEGVKMAYAVTGAFDVIVYAEVADMSAVGALINVIQSIEGVRGTHTAVAIPHRVDRA